MKCNKNIYNYLIAPVIGIMFYAPTMCDINIIESLKMWHCDPNKVYLKSLIYAFLAETFN